MRFLGVGDYNSLGDMYWRLRDAGHEVRVFVGDAESQDLYHGIVERSVDWEADLGWIRAAGDDGIILFESASRGAQQDALRRQGFHVVGGCQWGDRLEGDRVFGQNVMRAAGMQTAPVFAFETVDAGLAFLGDHPRRYVFKHTQSDAASTRNYVGQLDDGSDVAVILGLERKRRGNALRYVLMRHVEGVEVGVGAYFNGERFLSPIVLDWEHKRFFNGDLGELTGEMGTVVTYRGGERIFAASLGRLEEELRVHGYCGYINLNTIINAEGLWPLEFTCRFGYPGYAICDALHEEGWDRLFQRMVLRQGTDFATRPGLSVGVVLTVPPFPYEYGYDELSKGMPILFRDQADVQHRARMHFGEVARVDGQLVTAGWMGYVMVVTGVGDTIAAAQHEAYGLARQVVVPNLRYRTDIGDNHLRDRARLVDWGWMDPGVGA